MSVNWIIRADWLEASATQSVFAALEAGGFQARAVGGIVRNTLLGRPATDIDIATTALPLDTISLARAAGLKTFETGIAHGTVTVVADGVPYEVTTLRRDVETDGRHALVAFTDDWAADAARRDFTINALYCGRDGRVFDPLGGIADLDPVRIRFIGSAEQRIREDFLRILRFFRFTAAYGEQGVLDEPGLAPCIALQGGLDQISGERIQGELLKLLVARHAVAVTKTLVDSGVYSTLFGLAARFEPFARLAAIETAGGRGPDGVLRLGALGVAASADAAALDRRLKLSARDAKRLWQAGTVPALVSDCSSEHDVKRAIYLLGAGVFLDALLLVWARGDRDIDDAVLSGHVGLAMDFVPPAFPVTGGDVCELGVSPGPRVGALLKSVETAWIDSSFGYTRDQLLVLLRELVATGGA